MNNFYPMRLPDCFRILSVSPGGNWEEIKKSYYALAKRYHPDLNPGNRDFESRFKEISQAFKMLELHYKKLNPPAAGVKPFAPPVNGSDKPLEPELHVKNRFNNLPPFLKRLGEHPKIRKLAFRVREVLNECERKIFLLDVEKDITIDPDIAANGGTVRIRQGRENFEVPIPPGAWNKMSLRIPDKGEPSLFNRKRGDLLLNIYVFPGEKVREGDTNFFYQMEFSRRKLEEAGVHTLETFQGTIKFILPKNTRDGQSFVLKARTSSEATLRTNHIVTVQLV